MAEYIEALIVGAVQGLTEFLPVSSSGHLLVLSKLGVGQPELFFTVMLHVGTLLAVVSVYFKKIVNLILHPKQNNTLFLVLSSAVTVIMILIVKLAFPSFFDSLTEGSWVGFSFILTSVLLVSAEVFYRGTKKPNLVSSVAAGFAQGVSALLPGLSRSGSTIAAQTLTGVSRTDAADFSFLLSVPVIVGAALMESKDFITGEIAVSVNWGALAVGVGAAFLTGVLAIKFFMNVIKKFRYYPFAAYTFIMGIFSFVFLY